MCEENCVANLNGECVAKFCNGPIAAMVPPTDNIGLAARRYVGFLKIMNSHLCDEDKGALKTLFVEHLAKNEVSTNET